MMASVVLYTKNDCSFCNKAKILLQNYNIEYTSYLLYHDYDREWLITKYPIAKTFPVVVIDDLYIGGFKELNEYINNEKLILG